MLFHVLAERLNAQKGRAPFPKGCSLLCFDPGHTTGWAVFRDYALIDFGQIATDDVEIATPNVAERIEYCSPHTVVLEDYRVYKWKTEQHAGSELVTAQVIGCMKTICAMKYIPTVIQPAQVAKAFCKDSKLRQWNMYVKGEQHARDAIRHGCYFLLFGKVEGKSRGNSNQTVG